ncbi:lantibiotic immunity ABC transporter MutE/EpiE family permease subunit [Enterococcus faecium]|uniref:lantibiotic immunity ABC transporter MutE/EpiE family permease subunit n=1 Tax=Enterococcus faecium TaxID=1352 RepID=UPI00115D6532|nr:lantibiotic immunity ABC transporter MutE/EpiE family permease subunit [Enterococcus faecium]
MNGLKSELLKYKRTFTQKLILGIPLFFAVQAAAGVSLMPDDIVRTWDLVISMVFNVWTTIFLPFGIALFAVLVDNQERKSGNYRSLRSHNISPAFLWVNKNVAMAIHTFLASLVLVVAILVAGMLTASGDIPWRTILSANLVVWVVSLVLIPIQLWAASYKGLFLSMAIGFIGFITGIAAAPTSYWIFVPWSWSIRLLSPIADIHPNGTLLKAGNKLLDSSVIPLGIVVSLIVLIIVLALTAFWFKRRETR